MARAQGQHHSLWQKLVAELFGTFFLTGVGAGVDVTTRLAGGPDLVPRALAPALVVLALIYALGNVSGAHFNPAVTLAFAVRRAFPARHVPLYWLAQLGGSLLASFGLLVVFGSVSAGVHAPHFGVGRALATEVFLSLLLAVVILGAATRHSLVGPDAALPVGATISLCGLVGLVVDGASMNPARSLGPALATGKLDDAWIYVVGPVLGMLLAVLLTAALHPRHHGGEEEAASGE
jgi:aquaporin Z